MVVHLVFRLDIPINSKEITNFVNIIYFKTEQSTSANITLTYILEAFFLAFQFLVAS